MACRSDRDARSAAIVFTFVQVGLRSLLWLPIGVGLLVLFPPEAGLDATVLRADREASFVRGIAELLPAGARGLLLTAMLAALASTIDTHLNWGASYWTNDLYRRLLCQMWLRREPSDRSLVWVARASNGIILAVALAVMTQLDSIQTAWQTSLLLGAGMGVMLVLRWLWWRVNAWGELGAIGGSIVLAPVLLAALPPEREALRLLLMAGGSTLCGVGASLLTPPETPLRLREFYERARPPGAWHPIAAAVGRSGHDDVRRLLRGLAALVTAALCVFLLLAGLGSWIVHSPPPHWLPWRGIWIALQLAMGAALVPVWWRLGLRSTDEDGVA